MMTLLSTGLAHMMLLLSTGDRHFRAIVKACYLFTTSKQDVLGGFLGRVLRDHGVEDGLPE